MSNTAISEIQREALTVADDDLFVMSQKQPNGSHLTAKVRGAKLRGLKGDKGDKGKDGTNGLNGEKGKDGASAYQQWIINNTSENTYLTTQSIYQLFQTSSYNNIDTFLSKTNLTNVYNNWLASSVEVHNNFLTENNLTQAFNTYVQNNSTAVFNDFISSENLTDNYNTWLTTNKNTLIQLFMQTTSATTVYNSYTTTHPNVSAKDFLTAIGAQDGFNAWLADRVNKLTEDAFNRMMEGKTSKPVPTSKYEKFWMSICAIYQTPPEDALPVSFNSAINTIILPTDIFFEQQQQHEFFSSVATVPDIKLRSSTGFYIRKPENYGLDVLHIANPIELARPGNGTFTPFPMLRDGQRLYVKAGSVLSFEWSAEPSEDATVSLTLVAKKRAEPELDTAIVKLSGWFTLHDSAKGWVRNSVLDDMGNPDNLRMILNLSQFAFFSDDFLFDDSAVSNFFYYDFSAVATDYDRFYQHGTATIKNMSKIPRVLTLVPYNSERYISSIDETSESLPANAEIRDGSLVLTLAANQD